MIVIFSAMNLDRLVAILRPLAYLEAVRQQLKKDIKRQMFETEAWSRFFITHYQARQKRFGVPMLTLLCCLVTKNEFDSHKFNQQWFASKATLKNFGTLLEHHISSLWIFFTEKLIIINLENNYDQVAFIPPFPLLFIRTNMEGIGNKCDCMFPVQNVR